MFQSRSIHAGPRAQRCAHTAASASTSSAFNGPDGTQDAYAAGLLNHAECCYPNAKGQQLMAELLLETGAEPNGLS